MSDCDEGDVPYKYRACQHCHLSEAGLSEVACPNCGAVWPENLIERVPHDGKPDPWKWPRKPVALRTCKRCGQLNKTDAQHCKECGINFQWIDTQESNAVDHPAHYRKMLPDEAGLSGMTSSDIIALRGAYGFSRRDLARCLRLAPITVTRWEAGTSPPTGLAREILSAMLAAAGTLTAERCARIGLQLRLGIGAFIAEGLRAECSR